LESAASTFGRHVLRERTHRRAGSVMIFMITACADAP
jgi:hypothetical protein